MIFKKAFRIAPLIALLAVANLQAQPKPLQQTAGKTVIELSFKTFSLQIPTSSSNGTSELMGVEAVSDETQIINVSTPALKAKSVAKIPAQLLSNFDAANTIQADIKALGYSAIEIKKQNLASGHLYHWSTPTKGSASYFYLQNPKAQNTALKLGPIAGSILMDFQIEWSKAIWKKSNR